MFKQGWTLFVLFLTIRTISAFRNPLSLGADPFVHFDSLTGSYFVLFTRGRDIAIYSVASLDDLDSTEPTRYIYASGRHSSLDNYRLFALKSLNGSSPLGPYTWAGWLAPELNAIDASYFTWEGQGYFLWSQFEDLPNNALRQCVWLVPAATPARAGFPRVRLSCPQYPWEQTGQAVNEGPIALQRNGRLFITFSASLAMTPDYCMGLLEYKPRLSDGGLLEARNWYKRPEPVFQRVDALGIFGPGHNGFTQLADGTWVLIYHAKTTTGITFFDRVIHAKTYDWHVDGTPNFGQPEAPGFHGQLGPIKEGTQCPPVEDEVLERLLPIVIGKLNGAPVAVQKKVLEILAHVNKRVKALPSLQLPLHELVALYGSPQAGPMARNFALVYIENAAGRATAQARFAELDGILKGLASRPAAHQEILLRIAALCLEQMSQQGNAFEYGQEQQFASRYTFLSPAPDRQALLSFGLKLMLYQPPFVRGPSSALAAAQQAQQVQQPQPMEVDGGPAGPAVPAGLSRADVAAVEGKQAPTVEVLARRKLGLLNFSAAAGLDPSELLLVYLAASCDPQEQVSKRGEELLKKRCGVDSNKPAVDLESHELVERLYELFHGTLDDATLPEQERRAPAGVALRSRLLGLFSKSVAAANCFPHTLTAITTCLYGAGTTPRLRQQGMELAVWVFKHSAPQQLEPAAPAILEGCLNLLDTESTRGQDTVSLTLRGFTYQAIGQLAQCQPQAFAGRTDIAERFFTALASEPAGVRATVQESVSALGGAFKGSQGDVLDAVRQLLLEGVSHPQEVVRMAALQWALKLFPFQDVHARYICILGAADTRFSIAEAALDGLKPDKFATAAGSSTAAAASATNGAKSKAAGGTVPYPAFAAVQQYLLTKHPQLGRAVEESAPLPLPAKAFLAAISFLERCLERDGLDDSSAGRYLTLLENALVREAPSELHGAALDAMLAVAGRNRGAFTQAFAGRTSLLLRLLGHVDLGARWTAAKLLGMLTPALQPQQVQRLVEGLVGTVRPEGEGVARKPRFEELDGAIAALGFISAQLIMNPPDGLEPSLAPSALRTLRHALQAQAQDRQLASSAALGLGLASLAFMPGEGPSSVTSVGERKSEASPGGEGVLQEGGGLEEAAGVVTSVAALLEDKESKVVKRAAQALGYICRGHPAAPAVLLPAVDALLALKASKSEEVLFAAGEALCFAFGGVPVAATDILCTNFYSLADWMKQQEQAPQAAGQTDQTEDNGASGAAGNAAAAAPNALLPAAEPMETEITGQQAQQGEQAQQGSTVTATGDARSLPAQSEAQSKVLTAILEEYLFNTRTEVRCAGAVWLVSLVLYTGDHPRIAKLLPDIQDALSQLLGDSNELTQEMGSRGLAAVYNRADAATRQALVNALVGTLSGAPQKRRAVKVSGDTQIFEGGQLGAVPGGGSLTTYKELCALATDLGQPDLVYRFMELANHQAGVQSSRGAAFGFASIAKIAGEQLAPHINKMLPRLYRYLYDPNGKVRDAMSHIWHALLDDPKRSIAQHFGAIMAGLLKDMGSSQWRVREAAAVAMGDLLQGRRWEELQPQFEQLWTMTFRVMDDIKETVRQAGINLSRTVRGLTLRLADPEFTPASQGREAISTTLPFLLEKGLPSQVGEIQALSLDTSARLVKAAGPELVRPHLPLLVPAMLESLSGLEDSRLNYIEQHAERLGLDQQRLESARVAAAQGGPVGETLDLCARYIDSASLVALAPRLAALVRRGVGLNTRAGAGRFISQVARRLGSDTQPASQQLMKALVEACKTDRSGAVKRSFAAANAAVARFAAPARVEKQVASLLEMYGAEDADANTRLVAGLLLRELGKEAGDVFSKHAPTVAPLAFMAQCDDDADVAAMWHDVWEESATSGGAGLRLHVKEIAQLITAGLQSAQWGRKKSAAAALKKACAAAPDALQPLASALMETLLKELPGRLWDGKEVVLEAVGALASSCPQQLHQPQQQQQPGAAPSGAAGTAGGSSPVLAGRVVAALVEAAGKKKSGYRRAALEQLEAALSAFKGRHDHYEAASPLLLEQCAKFVAAQREGPRKMEVDGGGGGGTKAAEQLGGDDKATGEGGSAPIAQVVACLAAAWSTAGLKTAQQHAATIIKALADVLEVATKAADQLATALAATRVAEHCGTLAIVAAGGGAGAPLLAADPASAVRLLSHAIKLAGEGKAAQLREQCLALAKALLVQGRLWAVLGSGEQQQDVLQQLKGVAERERLPALKALALDLPAQLDQSK
ncbi:hypothetical protein N2152v2_002557 [Parachlorella kessleri]